MELGRLNTWIEISAAAHQHNLAFVRRLIGPEVELAAVVKSNAYGHGRRLVASLASRHGADSFAVHNLDEALDLRAAGFQQDVLIMGFVPRARLDEVVAGGFRQVLYDAETARILAAAAERQERPARVHLKIETGTNRQGLAGQELAALVEQVQALPGLLLEGAYSHFANIEDTTDHRYASQQLERFRGAIAELERGGVQLAKRHAACSAAVMLFPETHFDMVRVGISQYGFWSSKETRLSYQHLHGLASDDLMPLLTWKTRVSQVKTVPADAFVGYGCGYQTTRETRIAVLPTGYADGYDRRLSNTAHVLIKGRRAPVRGRVCMNLTMVDVTDIAGVEVADEVVLIGRQGEREISAEDLADLMGTIHYETVTRLAEHIPRLEVA